MDGTFELKVQYMAKSSLDLALQELRANGLRVSQEGNEAIVVHDNQAAEDQKCGSMLTWK